MFLPIKLELLIFICKHFTLRAIKLELMVWLEFHISIEVFPDVEVIVRSAGSARVRKSES